MTKYPRIKYPGASRGFTLLEMLLVLSISAGISLVAFQDKSLEIEQLQARKLGMELYQYHSALQNYLSNQAGDPNPTSLVGTKTGVNWLKSASCGGSGARDWVPCNFLSDNNQKTHFGNLSFSTTIGYSPQKGLFSKTVMSKLTTNTGGTVIERGDLSGLASLVAAGAYSLGERGQGLSQGNDIVFCPDISGTSSNTACATSKGQIVMQSQSLSEADRWLRVDHGNVMQDVIEFAQVPTDSPASPADLALVDSVNRQIRNVARIYNMGVSGNDALILGKKNGANALSMASLKTGSVIIDADEEILGKLLIRSSLTAEGDVHAKANLTVDGTTTAKGAVVAQSTLAVTGKTTALGGIESNQLIKGNADLSIANNAVIGGKITAANAQVNGTLTGNAINANGISAASVNGTTVYGNTVSGNDMYANQLTTNGVTRLNGTNILSANTHASRVIDADNGNYYMDMNNTSVLNGLNVNAMNVNGRLNANEYLYIGGHGSEGAGCGPNGVMGRTPAGALLSCVNGVWTSSSKMPDWRPASVAYNGNYCRVYKSSSDTDMYLNNQTIGASALNRLNSSYFIPLSVNTTITLERSYYTVDMGGNNSNNKIVYNDIKANVYDAYVDVERGSNSNIPGSSDCPTAFVR